MSWLRAGEVKLEQAVVFKRLTEQWDTPNLREGKSLYTVVELSLL